VWADGGYAGRLAAYARSVLQVLVAIVRKQEGQVGFEVLPRRWVVERTLSWIKWAMIGLMTRRIAPGPIGAPGNPRPHDHSAILSQTRAWT